MFDHIVPARYSALVLNVNTWVHSLFSTCPRNFSSCVVNHVIDTQDRHVAYQVKFGPGACAALFSSVLNAEGYPRLAYYSFGEPYLGVQYV